MQIPKVSSVPLFNIPHFDKIVHFSLYFILTSLWFTDYFKIKRILPKQQIFAIVFLGILYGSIMEIVQKVIVQNRSGDFFDALANTLGVIMAFFAFRYILFYRKLLLKIFDTRRKK